MLYNAINALAIFLGGLAGLFLKKGLPEKISQSLLQVIGLAVIYVGLSGLDLQANALLVIVCLVVGALIGQVIDIDRLFDRFAHALARLMPSKNQGDFSKGFISATVLFCAGSMGVTGALQAGAHGQGDILIAKALIDGITAIMYASSLGVGVLFSALAVFLYQGIFVLFANLLQPLLGPSVMGLIASVGGLIIMGIGFNLALGSKLPIANLLPAVFLPILFSLVGLI